MNHTLYQVQYLLEMFAGDIASSSKVSVDVDENGGEHRKRNSKSENDGIPHALGDCR